MSDLSFIDNLSDADVDALLAGDIDNISNQGVDLLSALDDTQLRAITGAEVPGGERTSIDLDARNAAAQSEIEANMNPLEKGLVGMGKTFNDIGRGVQQIFLNVTGDQEAAAEIGASLGRENETFGAFDDKNIGAEDVGQLLGDVAAMLPLGALGTSIKGGALLGGVLEGIKGTESGDLSDNAGNAAVGAVGGAAGGFLGKAISGIKSALTPGAKSIADDIGIGVGKEGMAELATGGILRMLGVGGAPSTGLLILNGAKRLSKQARASDAAKRFLTSRVNQMTSAEEKRLLAVQQKQMDDFSAKAYDEMLNIVNRMSTSNRKGVLSEETGLTLKDVVGQSTTKLPDGRVGINPADLAENMPFMSNPELKRKLGKTFGGEVAALRDIWQAQADTIMPEEEVWNQLIRFNQTITDETLPLMTKPNLTVNERKARKTLMDYIIGSSSVAGGQEAVESREELIGG